MPFTSKFSHITNQVKLALARGGLPTTSDDKQLCELYGLSKGRDAVVIGMGPSFRPDDVKRFEGYFTLACNKIFLMKDQSTWRPDIYGVTDYLVAEQNIDSILAYTGPKKFIHPAVLAKSPELRALHALRVDTTRSFKRRPAVFNDHPLDGIISGGGSVLMTLIQMAYWAGSKNIYLVGNDFSFSGGKDSGDALATGDKVLISEGEINHFHPDYRKAGETWTAPKLEVLKNGFQFAGEALTKSGVQLINASRTSKLDVLPRVPFDQQFPPIEEEIST